MKYKVLIPTSGTGSRLGEITKNTNKAIIPLAERRAIDYVLDSYPKDVPIVITLGYLGQSVKDCLEENYKDRNFEFVWVDKYEGPGSSLGYSMLQAKKNLQCPFIFHACDGIFVEGIPKPEKNWIGGFVEDWGNPTLPLEQYRTHTMKHDDVLYFNERGIKPFDSIHIGLDGIKDFELWWLILEEIYNRNPDDAQISDVPILDEMIKRGVDFQWIPYKIWFDTGNITGLRKAEECFKTTQRI